MSDQPLVSVIIIFLNAERFLQEAIDSVLGQTYPHWELLLVDDGSSDRSTALARHQAGRLPERVRYLEHPGHENRGMSATRNLGIRHGRGKYVALLDADDVWLPEKLAQQVPIIEANPDVGMVYGNTLYWHSWTGSEQDRARDYLPELGLPPDRVVKPPTLLERMLTGSAAVPCTCSVLIRRETLLDVGLLDERFRGMYEDQALYAKVALRTPVYCADGWWDRYRQHPDASCAVARRTGAEQAARAAFLAWLVEYLAEQDIEDPDLLVALRRESWRIRQPEFITRRAELEAILRRLKKWLLQFERRLLPQAMRYRVWLGKPSKATGSNLMET